MIPKSCPLTDKKETKKKERGYVECFAAEEADIYITRWLDNAVVTVASTEYGKNPMSKVGRYSRADKSKIQMSRPYAITRYNAGMGDTDRMDQNVNAYRIGTRGKKWWWSIFTYLIDVSVQNAWLLHRKGSSDLSQLQFRRSIVNRYCITLGTPKAPSGYRAPKTRDEFAVSRYDRVDHFIEVQPLNSKGEPGRRKCQGTCIAGPKGNTSSVTTWCKKCHVGLCFKCFKSYHYLPV